MTPKAIVYIADYSSSRIREVSNGVITTVAGYGQGFGGDGGPAVNALLNHPSRVAFDSPGNLYIADFVNNCVRMVSNGVITTVAGTGKAAFGGDTGPATNAQLNGASSIAVDKSGSLYIADYSNSRIRKVTNGVITTIAGNGTAGFSGDNGPATTASLNLPEDIVVDALGDVYFSDAENNRVRVLVPSGPSCSATVNPTSLSAPSSGATLNITINSAASCPWVVQSLPSWVTSSSGTVVHVGDATISLNVDPNFSSATRTAILSIAGIPVFIAQQGGAIAPTIAVNGVVPLDSSASTIQPGSWISIFGSSLATGTFSWKGDFPTSLGGVSVTIDGKPGFLSYVSPTQINLQAPDDLATGVVNVFVITPIGTTKSTVTLAPYAPSFCLADSQHVAAVIPRPDGSFEMAGPSNPVSPGEVVELFGVGFGPTNPPVQSGQAFSGAAATTSLVSVSIGGVEAAVQFSGLTSAGLYQLNVVVPNGVGGESWVQANIGDAHTQYGVYLYVK